MRGGLLLERKAGESIIVHAPGGNITITVNYVRLGNRVGVYVEAPRTMLILRAELEDEAAHRVSAETLPSLPSPVSNAQRANPLEGGRSGG